jgi:hypothetical protein
LHIEFNARGILYVGSERQQDIFLSCPKGKEFYFSLKTIPMNTLDLKSWEKASTIYRWNLVLTVITMGIIIPRIFPIGSIAHILNIHIQWRAVIMFPFIYLTFTLVPLLLALLAEALVFLFSRRYSMNAMMQICYVLWILEVLLVIAGAFDAWFFQYAHHLPVLNFH